MSDWGLTAFYYDYEIPHSYKGMNRIKGLVSRAYKYPGVPGMIMHAYNGVRYLWERYQDEYYDFDLVREYGRLSDWDALNMSFDVLFDYCTILPGYDTIKATLRKFDSKGKKKDSSDETDGSSMTKDGPTDGDIDHSLFSCEGMYGWIFSTFTGNPDEGYKLRYGYDYGFVNEDWESVDMRRALEIYEEKHGELSEIPEPLEEAMKFFDDNAVLIPTEEFWKTMKPGVEVVKQLMKELRWK